MSRDQCFTAMIIHGKEERGKGGKERLMGRGLHWAPNILICCSRKPPPKKHSLFQNGFLDDFNTLK